MRPGKAARRAFLWRQLAVEARYTGLETLGHNSLLASAGDTDFLCVLFHDQRCYPCRGAFSMFTGADKEMQARGCDVSCRFAVVDAQANIPLFRQLGLAYTPSFVLFHKGRHVATADPSIFNADADMMPLALPSFSRNALFDWINGEARKLEGREVILRRHVTAAKGYAPSPAGV